MRKEMSDKKVSKTILMILSNPFNPDTRVFKEAKSLIEVGFCVTIIAWDRGGKNKAEEKYGSLRVIRLRVISSYKSGLTNVLKLLAFYGRAILKVIALKPDIIHCHDLDTLIVGIIGKLVLSCDLVYDAHEYYPEMIFLPVIIRRLLACFEFTALHFVNGVIAASTFTARKFERHTSKKIVVLNNSAETSVFDEISSGAVRQRREALGLTDDDLVLVYVGGYSENRKIEELILASSELRKIKVVIVGPKEGSELLKKAKDISNVVCVGWVAPREVPIFTSMADICYYAYDPKSRYADYVNPNALFNAIAAGKPIIGTDVGDMGTIIKEEQCGYIIDEPTVPKIRLLLEQIQKSSQLNQYAENARKASLRKYNWEYTKRLLIDCYKRL